MLRESANLQFPLSSNSFPQRLVGASPSHCIELVPLWNFQGTPHLLLLYLALFPKLDAKILRLSYFCCCCWFLFLPPPRFHLGWLWEFPHVLSSMLPFCHIASSLITVFFLNYYSWQSSASLTFLRRTLQWSGGTTPTPLTCTNAFIYLNLLSLTIWETDFRIGTQINYPQSWQITSMYNNQRMA